MTTMSKDGIDLEIGVIEQDAIDRMLEKVPIDELVRDYLGDEKAKRLNDLYKARDELDKEVTKVAERIRLTMCPGCECQLSIWAVHRYLITQDNKGEFHKDEGDVKYECGRCGYVLGVSEIEDALRQVDEL